MSSLFKMFGGGGSSRPAAPTNNTQNTAAAIQRIQEATAILDRKSQFLEKKIQNELIEAKV